MSLLYNIPTIQMKSKFGNHSVLTYNKIYHPFKEYFQKLFQTNNIEQLHLRCSDYSNLINGKINDICDIETDLHKTFYKDIKENDTFKQLYINLIRNIYHDLFLDEECLIYQSFPSVRFQFPNSIAVPPHYDSDDIGKHPLGEKNFLVPITNMYNSQRLFIESSPSVKDFKGIDLEYGEIFFFNGNKCTHYNEKNIENSLRISLDFRIMLASDYIKYINNGDITMTNPRDPDKKRIPTKMIIGGYYQIVYKNDTIDKMMKWHFQRDFLLQSRPVFNEEEAVACYNYIKGDNFITEFKYTEQLEKDIAKFINVKHCVMTTSGNVAIILALMAADISKDDEVIVPNYTMIATINSVKMLGAKPIIIDVDKDSLTMSINDIKEKITYKTKAILHVSLNNRHSDIHLIKEYCEENNIILIEDAAQSLGCFIDNKHFGTFGKMGCFSLSTPKIISTGQGGFIVTDDDNIANKMRMIKNFGRKEAGNDIFELFGINFKFTDIQAVIGIEQLKKLPERMKRLREIFDLYYFNLKDVCKMVPPQSDTWIPWFVDIFVEKRDELMTFLKSHNIQTRATYPEINKTPMYFDEYTFTNSHYISTHGLFLPTHMLLTDSEIIHICNLIRLFYNKLQ
jgi:perosamine synthetase